MSALVECPKCRWVHELDPDDPARRTTCERCSTPLPSSDLRSASPQDVPPTEAPAPAPAESEIDPLSALFPAVEAPPAASEETFGPAAADGRPRYELLEKVGQDSAGTVFHARDRETGSDLTVRLLPSQNGEAQTSALDRYLKKAFSLQHANILRLHGTGRRGDQIYIASDLASGGSIAGVKDVRSVCVLVRDAAAGLHHAHQQGVFHGDLHPANLVVSQEGGQDRGLVKDFRLAHALESLTPMTPGAAPAFVRNPSYLAPELAEQRSKALNAATDVYGLGAALYAVLAGRPPFEGRTTGQVLGRVMMGEPAAIEKIRPEVPEPLAAVIRRSMAKDSALRYPDAKHFAEALSKVLQICWPVGEPAPAPTGEAEPPDAQEPVEAAPAAAPVTAAPAEAKPEPSPVEVKADPAAPEPEFEPIEPAPSVPATPVAAAEPKAEAPVEKPVEPAPPKPAKAAPPAPPPKPVPLPVEVKAPPPPPEPKPVPAAVPPPAKPAAPPDRKPVAPRASAPASPERSPERRRSLLWPAAAAFALIVGGGVLVLFKPWSRPPGPESVGPAVPPTVNPAVAEPPKANPGVLELDVAPVPLELRVGGRGVDPGHKTVSLPPGTHRVEAVFENTVRLERTVEVASGQIHTFQLRAYRDISRSWERMERWGEAERSLLEALGKPADDSERRELEQDLARLKTLRLEAESVLRVETDPPGAEVVLDGRPAGQTPLTLSRLKGGEHLLEFRRDGYVSETRRFVYEVGKGEPIRVQLKPRAGLVRVKSARSGDVVKLLSRDGREIHSAAAGPDGSAEFASIPVGEYDVQVERRGHDPVRVRVVVVEGRVTEAADLVFKEKPGALSVTSDPAGAEVFLDGRSVGRTPVVLPTLTAGVKKVRIAHPEALDWEGEARVVAEEKAEVKASLVRAGKLTVEAHPEGARVTGALEGATRVQGKLRAGEHRIRVQHPEAGAVERTVRVAAGEEVTEAVDLWEERGKELEKSGTAEQAIRAYEKARPQAAEKALGKLFDAVLAQATRHVEARDWAKAREAAALALKIRPGNPELKSVLAAASFEEAIAAAEEAVKLRDWGRARREAEKAAAMRRGDRRAAEIAASARIEEALVKGREAEASGQWTAAKAAYEEVRSARPGNAEAAEGLRRLNPLDWREAPVVSGFTLSLAFSPSGRLLALGGVDKTVRLWDLETAKLARTLTGHGGAVTSLSFRSDGETLASGSQDGTIKLWDVSGGRLLDTLTGHRGPVWSVALAADGKSLASGGEDRTIRLWDPAEGKETSSWSAHGGPVLSVVFAAGGKQLASGGGDGVVKLWDAAAGKAIRTFAGHSAAVYHLAVSPDGKKIVSGSGDKTVRLWDADEGKELRTLTRHTKGVYQVAFRADGRLIASSAGDKTVRLWHAESGSEVRTLSGHSSEVWAVAFSPSGDYIVSVGTDGVRRWSR